MNITTGSQNSVISKSEEKRDLSPVLPEIYKRRLHRILRKDSEKICMHFFDLNMSTLNLLIAERTSVKRLKEYVSLLPLLTRKNSPTLADVVEPARKVYDVIFILIEQHFITFYKFRILESIIKRFCIDKEDKLSKELEEYKEKFKVYIKRRVCESSLYYSEDFHPGDLCTLKEGCKLILITDESWNHEASLETVLDLEDEVADIFGIERFVLDLKAIEESCLRLYHNIPPDVEHVILSIKHEQVVRLKSCGIAELHCGDCHIVLQTCKCKCFNLVKLSCT